MSLSLGLAFGVMLTFWIGGPEAIDKSSASQWIVVSLFLILIAFHEVICEIRKLKKTLQEK